MSFIVYLDAQNKDTIAPSPALPVPPPSVPAQPDSPLAATPDGPIQSNIDPFASNPLITQKTHDVDDPGNLAFVPPPSPPKATVMGGAGRSGGGRFSEMMAQGRSDDTFDALTNQALQHQLYVASNPTELGGVGDFAPPIGGMPPAVDDQSMPLPPPARHGPHHAHHAHHAHHRSRGKDGDIEGWPSTQSMFETKDSTTSDDLGDIETNVGGRTQYAMPPPAFEAPSLPYKRTYHWNLLVCFLGTHFVFYNVMQ